MTRLISAAAIVALTMTLAAQDKGVEVMQQAREALGGNKLAQVQAIAIEGPFAREMGNRQMKGTLALTLQLPDRMHRVEDVETMGGMSIERTAVLTSDKAWEDIQNRGGMGGGTFVMRTGPPGQELNPEQLEQARLRRMRVEFNRYLLAFLGGGSLEPTFVAVAEAPEGKADVLEVKNDAGQTVRLFIDQQTHLPLMLQYTEVRPRMMFNGPGGPGGTGMRRGPGGPGGPPPGGPPPEAGGHVAVGPPPGPDGQRPNPEEIRRRMESMPPPEPSAVSLYLGDYKRVDGVMLPHRVTQAVDGKTVEEWTIEKIKVNPTIKADLFDKK